MFDCKHCGLLFHGQFEDRLIINFFFQIGRSSRLSLDVGASSFGVYACEARNAAGVDVTTTFLQEGESNGEERITVASDNRGTSCFTKHSFGSQPNVSARLKKKNGRTTEEPWNFIL